MTVYDQGGLQKCFLLLSLLHSVNSFSMLGLLLWTMIFIFSYSFYIIWEFFKNNSATINKSFWNSGKMLFEHSYEPKYCFFKLAGKPTFIKKIQIDLKLQFTSYLSSTKRGLAYIKGLYIWYINLLHICKLRKMLYESLLGLTLWKIHLRLPSME